jgi:hypothetical protein
MMQIDHLVQAAAEETGCVVLRRHLRRLSETNTCMGGNRGIFNQ